MWTCFVCVDFIADTERAVHNHILAEHPNPNGIYPNDDSPVVVEGWKRTRMQHISTILVCFIHDFCL